MNKLLRMELKRVKRGRDEWRMKCRQLQKGLRGERVKNHPYSLQQMVLGVMLHITSQISLRGTAKALHAFGLIFGQQVKQVSATTIRNWSLRLGLYFLTKPVAPGRYALIVDESVSMGQEKLLVMLAVKLGDETLEWFAPLQMSDVEVLHIQAKPSWKGADICRIIEQKKAANKGFELVYGLSDRGPNLLNGFRLCRLRWVGDCTHLLADCTKKLYRNDTELNELVKAMNASRAKWSLSRLAVYAPPGLRKKARFHQLFAIYKWADMILQRWEALPQEAKDELAYLQNNRKLIETMKQIHVLVEDFSGLVKGKGIHSRTESQWIQCYENRCLQWKKEPLGIDSKLEVYHSKILEFIAQTRAAVPGLNQILCCSDIIESIFGKYKNKGHSPMITDDALKIAAFPKVIQMEDVIAALASKSTTDLKEWKRENTTISLMAQRRVFKSKMAA